ncbi:hypothetical protein AMS68_004792 [Peltaster fructicola]|uniref:Uncharacterized protein n=1 Tax=Peltaster fructicola TaxID=286661 RepID=A0A6H0XX87_9PEZI|nr:hypothetical protein AMS68_004792 [Peltaster fructicola]
MPQDNRGVMDSADSSATDNQSRSDSVASASQPDAPAQPSSNPAHGQHIDALHKSVKVMTNDEFFATHPRGTGGYIVRFKAKPGTEAESEQVHPPHSSPAEADDDNQSRVGDVTRSSLRDVEREGATSQKAGKDKAVSDAMSKDDSNEETSWFDEEVEQATLQGAKQLLRRMQSIHDSFIIRKKMSEPGLGAVAKELHVATIQLALLLYSCQDDHCWGHPDDVTLLQQADNLADDLNQFLAQSPRLSAFGRAKLLGECRALDHILSPHVPWAKPIDPESLPDYMAMNSLRKGTVLKKVTGPNGNLRDPIYQVYMPHDRMDW